MKRDPDRALRHPDLSAHLRGGTAIDGDAAHDRLLTPASASDGAKAQGFTIPGNRVVGVFRNDFARRMLAASVPAGIEAPIRLYLTENADGTATLSYRKPSAVFGPYLEGAMPDLKAIATELDAIFDQIAKAAVQR